MQYFTIVTFPPVHNVGTLTLPEGKVSVKLSLCLTKPNVMKTYLALNHAPRHEDIWGVKVYIHALTSALVIEVSDQLHSPAALTSGKESPVPIGQEAGWDDC